MCLSILLRKPSNCNAFNKNDSCEVIVHFFPVSQSADNKLIANNPKQTLNNNMRPPPKKSGRIEVNRFALRIPIFLRQKG